MAMIACSFFDGAEVELDAEPATPTESAALAAFLQLGPSDRLAASRHVYAYYCDFHNAVGGEDWLDAAMGIPASPDAIWNHVHPLSLYFQADRSAAVPEVYLMIEANCAWEEEHGLLLCFRGGAQLTKCGQFDGHITNVNAYAYADDAMADIVYAATDPTFTTRLDQ